VKFVSDIIISTCKKNGRGGGIGQPKKIAFISTPYIQLNLRNNQLKNFFVTLSCCCYPLPPGTTSLPVFVYLSVRLFFLADDNAAMQITVSSSSSSVCVFYLIHRPTSQHTHTLAPAAFPLFLTHPTHTKSKKDDKWLLCQLCNTHKSDA
jgi:hypothetical protein